MNIDLNQYIRLDEQCSKQTLDFTIIIKSAGQEIQTDFSCFILDESDLLLDTKHLVFYNQRSTPCHGVKLISTDEGVAHFRLNLSSLPRHSCKLAFFLSFESPSELANFESLEVKLTSELSEITALKYVRSGLPQCQSIMLGTLEFQQGWVVGFKAECRPEALQSWVDAFTGTSHHYGTLLSAPLVEGKQHKPIQEPAKNITTKKLGNISEHDLYPELIKYLNRGLGLNCMRINEKRSSNKKGKGGNKWLHPDIVALETVDQNWDTLVRNCVRLSNGLSARLWSFEVKKELTGQNARMSFFQAVSNSAWANEGYLVTCEIHPSVEHELKMLSSLHGIGVILLNLIDPEDSRILLPSAQRERVDWLSANRIVCENVDYKEFIDLVSTYYETGRLRASDWNN